MRNKLVFKVFLFTVLLGGTFAVAAPVFARQHAGYYTPQYTPIYQAPQNSNYYSPQYFEPPTSYYYQYQNYQPSRAPLPILCPTGYISNGSTCVQQQQGLLPILCPEGSVSDGRQCVASVTLIDCIQGYYVSNGQCVQQNNAYASYQYNSGNNYYTSY